MRAEIEEVAAGRQYRISQGAGCLGEQDLLAIADREEARQPVQARSDVVAVSGGCVPDMNRHPHAQRSEIAPIFRSQRRLCREGRRYSCWCGRKGGLDRIADGLE